MKEYILGLDIGITSVGYGLIDYETREVITAGVRLFKEADVENNEGRRTKRGSRRLQRRRIHRIQQLMVNNLLTDQYHTHDAEGINANNEKYDYVEKVKTWLTDEKTQIIFRKYKE